MVANFSPSYVVNFWLRCASGNIFIFGPFFLLKISLLQMLIAVGNEHLKKHLAGMISPQGRRSGFGFLLSTSIRVLMLMVIKRDILLPGAKFMFMS